MARHRIPVYEPLLGEEEAENLRATVASGWISAGPFVEKFESEWAAQCGRRFGVAVSSGTAGLWLAVKALGIGHGDEVLMPTFTMVACALAAVRNGAAPAFVDSDPHTWTMDASATAAAITPRTRAIMPVHIYGHPVDMDPVLEIARRRGLAVVEDAAEAHGAEYMSQRFGPEAVSEWRPCGSFGDASVFSFYANKAVACGEGGMVLTDDEALAARLRSLRTLCPHTDARFVHDDPGFNHKMSDLQAAVGVAQAARLGRIIALKRALAKSYMECLSPLAGRIRFQAEAAWARSSWWVFGILLQDGCGTTAQGLSDALRAKGIETRAFFSPMHLQPFLGGSLPGAGSHPVAERLGRDGLYLPSGPGLTESQVDEVCAAVRGELGA